jgi:cytochrome c oxidase subunit II
VNIPSSILTLLLGIFLTLASLWYGQNHGLLPVAASSEAELVDGLFNTMMTIGFGLFLLVEGALVIAAVRFRRREGDEGDGEHLEGNIPLEIVWTAIPAVVVLGISIYSFDIYSRMGGLDLMNHSMAPAKVAPAENTPAETKSVEVAYVPKLGQMPLLSQADRLSDDILEDASLPEGELVGEAGLGLMPDMEAEQLLSVNVQGMQYAFIFNYPNGIVDGELHIPINQPVELNLNAQDVLHAFWLPEFRIKQDMIPGQETKLVFNAIREGTYPVVCAELCGPYHGGMRTQIIVQSADDYAAWVDSRLTAMAAGETVAGLPVTMPVPAAERTATEYLKNFVEPMQLAIAPESLAALHPHHHD